MTESSSAVVWRGCRGGLDYKKHKKTLWGGDIFPILVCGSGFLDCVHMLNLIFIYTLKICMLSCFLEINVKSILSTDLYKQAFTVLSFSTGVEVEG